MTGKLSLIAVFALGMLFATGAPAFQKQSKEKQSHKLTKKEKKMARGICDAVEKFVSAGKGSAPYEMIKGNRDYDQGGNEWIAYDSAVYLPGAESCTIFTDRSTGQTSYVVCIFARPVDASTTEASLLAWEREIITSIEPCLPKDWKPIDDRRQHSAGYYLKGEGDPGQKIEIQLMPPKSAKEREVQVNFYPK